MEKHPIKLRMEKIDRESNPSHAATAAPNGSFDDELDFTFELCRKPVQFGDVLVDQFWFELSSLYPEGTRPAKNFQSIVDFFWALCQRNGTVEDDGVLDTWLLVNLLPFVRRNGAKRIVNDAVLTNSAPSVAKKQAWLQELDGLLQNARNEEMDCLKFQRDTADYVGPLKFPEDVRKRYFEFEHELLSKGRSTFRDSPIEGLKRTQTLWNNWTNSIGRRSGKETEKQILDVLSYEARAAFHQCYCAVWIELLPCLLTRFKLSPESMWFHCLWHCEYIMPSQDDQRQFHLFHGHVFALHPGTSVFIKTQTGGELVGDWIRDALKKDENNSTFKRLLNGLNIAICDYSLRANEIQLARSGQGLRFGDNSDTYDENVLEWQE